MRWRWWTRPEARALTVVRAAAPAQKSPPKPRPRPKRKPAPLPAAAPPAPLPEPVAPPVRRRRLTLADRWPEVQWMPSYHRRVFALLVTQSLTVHELDRAIRTGCRYPASKAIARLLRTGMIRPVAALGPDTLAYKAVPPSVGVNGAGGTG